MDEQILREALRIMGKKYVLRRTPDGYWQPRPEDACEMCINAKWIGQAAPHMKTPAHVTRKLGISLKQFKVVQIHLEELMSQSSIRFKCLTLNDEGVLVSPSHQLSDGSSIWPPQAVVTATCTKLHQVPTMSCSCGLYVFNRIAQAIEYGQYGPNKSVTVALEVGGKCIDYTEGGRVECALIVGVYQNEELAEKYGVPVFTSELDFLDVNLDEEVDEELDEDTEDIVDEDEDEEGDIDGA